MRQIMSTALTALIVAALTAVSISALAQTAPATEQAIIPAAARGNADRVDGKHAVSFTNKRGRRANKLVATNKQGLLPSNIVKPLWGKIKGKPGFLADGRVSWDEIAGMPAGFADGVDAADTTYSYIAAQSPSMSGNGYLTIDYPANLAVQVTLIPQGSGFFATRSTNVDTDRGEEIRGVSGGMMHHYLYFNVYNGTLIVKARVTVFNAAVVAPTAAKTRISATFHKGTKVPRR